MPRCRRSTWEASTDGLADAPTRRERRSGRSVSEAGRIALGGARRSSASEAAAAARAAARRRGPRRLLRPRPRAAGRELHARRAACSASSAATAWARRRCATRSPGWCRRAAACASPAKRSSAWRRTRSRGAASPTCRRAGASGRRCRSTRRCAWWRANAARRRPRLRDVPAPRRAQGPRRRAAFRRRAADARDRPRAAARAAPAGDGRADRRPRAGDRRAGRARRCASWPASGEIAVLLIEQNLGVAIDVADRIGVMVNGRIAQEMSARRARRRPRRCRSGCSACARSGDDEEARAADGSSAVADAGADATGAGADGAACARRRRADARRRRRRAACAASTAGTPATRRRRSSTSRAAGAAAGAPETGRRRAVPTPSDASRARRGARPSARRAPRPRRSSTSRSPRAAARAAYVAGTFDTKGRELFFLRQCLEKLGLRVVTVDLATSGKPSTASVHPREVARHHPDGERAVFSDDRGSAVSAMAIAFERFIAHAARPRRPDLGRRLRRHHARDAGDARAAGRRAEGDGVDDGVGRHAAVRRPERHLHDVFGHRRAGHQPHQREGARQRGACAGRDDRAPAAGRRRRPSRRSA